MGGQNSGRHWRYDAKDKVDSKSKIDVHQWQRAGLLIPERTFESKWSRNGQVVGSIRVVVDIGRNYMVLFFRYRQSDGEWKDVAERVFLNQTPCNYGGQRMWFHCPTTNCNRRVAILYQVGRYFLCRKCCHLVYRSQSESFLEREARKADKIQAQLGWEGGIFDLPGKKPKGMRWRTFKRLEAQHEAIVDRTLIIMDGIARKF